MPHSKSPSEASGDNGATVDIVANGSPLAPLSTMATRTLDGNLEYNIAIYCRHLNGDHWRKWRKGAPLPIGDNGCIAIGDKKWRQWRKSQFVMTLLPQFTIL